MISTNSIAPQGPPIIWSPGAVLRGCCGLCSLVEPRHMHHTLVIFGSSLLGTCVCVITAAACAGVCMVLLIVFSQCFPDSSVQNFRRNFAVVMGPCTSRYGPKVSRNLGGFLRNNETKFGWVLNETWTQAKPSWASLTFSALLGPQGRRSDAEARATDVSCHLESRLRRMRDFLRRERIPLPPFPKPAYRSLGRKRRTR